MKRELSGRHTGISRRTASLGLLGLGTAAARSRSAVTFACAAENDLYRAMSAGASFPRYDDAATAVSRAPENSGLLVLADGYPRRTTVLEPALFELASRKKLRIFLEYPAAVPGLQCGEPRHTEWERVVVASGAFDTLERLSLLAVHDCRFVPIPAAGLTPVLVAARVAGYDTAVFGLPAETWPILFEHPRGGILVSTTGLSRFVIARYAPAEGWAAVWRYILGWLVRGGEAPAVRWTPVVRPSYRAAGRLPARAEAEALRRGLAWFRNSKMFVGPSWEKVEREAGKWPDRVGPAPAPDWPPGDGGLGMLEGFSSTIRYDGSQPVRWWLRNDCMGEAALTMALAGELHAEPRGKQIAANLADFICFKSDLAQGTRADPHSTSFGLVGWNTAHKYWRDLNGFDVYYGDDNARGMLGLLGAAAVLGSSRWDERALLCLLANFRTTGRLGFRQKRFDGPSLDKRDWQYYFDSDFVLCQPHYEAYLWAVFLWAHDKTRFAPLLERTRNAIRMTMEAYPDRWCWTNGIQQERARMLLPLAWLVRVEDTPRNREWLKFMACEILRSIEPCGAIREELGAPGMGDARPPRGNAEYGTAEAPLIQRNGDPACDLLYTMNFAFLGLHEAAAATNERTYRDAAGRIAQFLCRVQVRSEGRPELDGGWFRAFDFRRWEYWASNADSGWGAWAIEAGWTQTWICSVLAMRRMKTSLWDLTARSGVGACVEKVLPLMLPGVRK